MTDDRGIVRGFSQDRQTYRHNSISMKRKPSIQIDKTSEDYYSNRNCPEIISLWALTNKHLNDREKQIYHSVSNDTHYFNMINYPIQSPPPAPPIPKLVSENTNQQNKQPKFPKVKPTTNSTTIITAKKFSISSTKGTSNVDNKKAMPTIRTSVKPISSSFNKPTQTKMPMVSNEKKKKIELSPNLRRRE